MLGSDYIAARFNALSVLGQSFAIVAAAMAGADLLTLIFYSVFFSDRLMLDLLLTSLIVIAVASPLTYFFLARSPRFADLAAELDRTNRVDDLTGLLNRKTFLSEAKRQMTAEGENTVAGTLLFIDADYFKAVNDTFGHAKGDAVLGEIGAVLKSCIRKGDLAARLGGEEFAVFVAGAGHERVTQLCERIRRSVKEISGTLGLDRHNITVSIGASLHHSGQDLDDLLLAADRNLYAAKANGRDCTVQTDAERIAA